MKPRVYENFEIEVVKHRQLYLVVYFFEGFRILGFWGFRVFGFGDFRILGF